VIWRGFIVLALLLLAAMSLLVSRRDRDDAPERARREPPQPGYYMTDAEITEMSETGQPVYRVNAERIVQDPTDLGIRLENLKLGYRAGLEREWTLTADRGFVPPGSKTIDLQGDVEITGLPVESEIPAVIRTERLSLDTETNVATTRSRVDIVWGGRRLTTLGLKADLKAEKLQLESGVHGRFVR
jgi:LPS export ABC transporter protein LptC